MRGEIKRDSDGRVWLTCSVSALHGTGKFVETIEITDDVEGPARSAAIRAKMTEVERRLNERRYANVTRDSGEGEVA